MAQMDGNVTLWRLLTYSLPVSLRNGMTQHGIDSLEKLCALSPRDILGWKNCGERTIKKLEAQLAFVGLHLFTPEEDMPPDLLAEIRDLKRRVDALEKRT